MPVSLQGALSIIHGGITAALSLTIEGELDASGQKIASTQVLSTSLADISIGAIAYNQATWFGLANLAAVGSGQDATITRRIELGSLTKQADSAGNAVPATSPGGAGTFYEITSAGTSQSKTWAVGEWAIYSGTSGVYFQIQPNVNVGLCKAGEVFGPIKLPGNTVTPYRAKAATGTPTLQVVCAGPLA